MRGFSIILFVCAVIFMVMPDIFKRGIWKETAITQKIFSPKDYRIYMRIVGVVFFIVAIYFAWKYNRHT